MAKIAVVNVGMHGHVNPTLGFTEELVRRGADVVYFGDPAFAPQIERTGARLATYGSQVGKLAAARAKCPAGMGADGPSMYDRFVSELEQTLPVLLAELARERPAAVVYNFMSLAGRIAVSRLAIPAVQFFTTYAANETYNVINQVFAKRMQLTDEQRAAHRRRLDRVTAQYGGPPLDPDNLFGHAEPANLVFLPRAFHPHGDAFDDRYHFVGPCLRSGSREATTHLLPDSSGPLLVIALGTMFNAWPEFYRDCLAAFGGKPWRVAMAIGPHVEAAALGPIPANVVVRPHLPQLALLRQAALFVSHGGMNSTMEALYFGVPLVVVPQMEEQEMTARQVAALGLGQHVPRDEAAAGRLLAAAAEVVGSAAIRAAVAAMQAQIIAAGGTPRAADVIDAVAGGAGPKAPRRPAPARPADHPGP